jgi:phosphoglycolate phosphatase
MHHLVNIDTRQLILLDLDGTLVDSAPDLHQAMNLALDDLGRAAVTQQQIRVWVGQGASQLCGCVIRHQDQQYSDGAHQQLLQAFLTHYQRHLCVDSQVYAGVLPFLDYCRQCDITLACVTNKPYQAARALLEQLHLAHYFQLLLGGDSLSQHKPHPAQLLFGQQHFAMALEQCLMIGDSRNDVEAARAAGMDCIVLSYGYNHGEPLSDCQPQLIIDSLYQLIPNPV